MKRFLPLLLLVAVSATADMKPRIIFDTDFGGDADDLGALAMLHNMQHAGELELLAVMNWNLERHATPAIVALNEWYGHGDVPVAARSGDAWEGDWQYSKPVVEALGASTDAAVPDTTDLYRKLLASADHRSVTIVTVGPLANILYLLNSGPDQHSRKTGRALVSEKVKEFIIMGGQYPSGEDEWNFNGDMPGVTRKVLAAIDVPVIFSGFEVGEVVRTGVEFNDLDPSHPLHAGYLHFSEHAPWMKERFVGDILDNASFDQTAVLYAVRGGVPEWWTLSEPGRVVADDVGGNGWESDDAGQHRYLVMTGNPDEVASVIRDAMLGPEGAPEAQ